MSERLDVESARNALGLEACQELPGDPFDAPVARAEVVLDLQSARLVRTFFRSHPINVRGASRSTMAMASSMYCQRLGPPTGVMITSPERSVPNDVRPSRHWRTFTTPAISTEMT